MAKLRFFLYLDEGVVSQFLAQTEGGTFEDQRIKDQSGRSTGIGGAVSAGPVTARADRASTGSSETEFTMRQTGPSRFNRLHRALSEDGGLTSISALDEEIWAGLEVGEILELEVTAEVPTFVRDLGQMGDIAGLGPLVEVLEQFDSLGLPGMTLDDTARREMKQAKKMLPAVSGIAEIVRSAPMPCLFGLTGTPGFNFFARLDRANLLVDAAELKGEMRILVKVDRLIDKRKPETISVIPGLPNPSRGDRRKGGGSPHITLRYPTAVVTVVAAYR